MHERFCSRFFGPTDHTCDSFVYFYFLVLYTVYCPSCLYFVEQHKVLLNLVPHNNFWFLSRLSGKFLMDHFVFKRVSIFWPWDVHVHTDHTVGCYLYLQIWFIIIKWRAQISLLISCSDYILQSVEILIFSK